MLQKKSISKTYDLNQMLRDTDDLLLEARVLFPHSEDNQTPQQLLNLMTPQTPQIPNERKNKKVIMDESNQKEQKKSSIYIHYKSLGSKEKCELQEELENLGVKKRLKKKKDYELQVAQENPNLCSICFDMIDGKEIAIISGCMHLFCYECISTYGKQYKNVCPLCRKSFNQITKAVKCQDGEFLKKEIVNIELIRKIDSSEEEEGFVEYLDDDSDNSGFIVEDFNCEVCGCYEGDEEAVYQCIRCLQSICHIHCTSVRLNWICEWCRR